MPSLHSKIFFYTILLNIQTGHAEPDFSSTQFEAAKNSVNLGEILSSSSPCFLDFYILNPFVYFTAIVVHLVSSGVRTAQNPFGWGLGGGLTRLIAVFVCWCAIGLLRARPCNYAHVYDIYGVWLELKGELIYKRTWFHSTQNYWHGAWWKEVAGSGEVVGNVEEKKCKERNSEIDINCAQKVIVKTMPRISLQSEFAKKCLRGD